MESKTSLERIQTGDEADEGVKSDIFNVIYLDDTVGKQEYILVKDFHFNLCKTLYPLVDRIFAS